MKTEEPGVALLTIQLEYHTSGKTTQYLQFSQNILVLRRSGHIRLEGAHYCIDLVPSRTL